MAEKSGVTTDRTTLYTWAESLGEDERRQLSVMPEAFKTAATAAFKDYRAEALRRSRLIDTISKMTTRLTEVSEAQKKSEERLNKYADRIRAAVKAASMPVEEVK